MTTTRLPLICRAKDPFERIAKEFADTFEQQQYEEFWEEFDARLGRAAR